MADNDLRIWHDRSAGDEWLRAMPLGNGRIGAMVFGNTERERLQINEDTFYALEPENCQHIPEGIPESLPGVVNMLQNGDYRSADEIVSRHWLGRSNAPYQPLADLWIDIGHNDTRDYTHELSLADAVARCTYKINGVTFRRDAFISYVDQALVIRLSSDKPASINLSTWVDTVHKPTLTTCIDGNTFIARAQGPGEAFRRDFSRVRGWGDEHKYPNFYEKTKDGEYVLRHNPDHNVLYADDVHGLGMFFEVRLRVLNSGGDLVEANGKLTVNGADEVLLLLTADTSFNGIDKSPSREGVDPSIQAVADLEAAASKSFDDLLSRHIADYQSLFNRVDFTLGEPGPNASLPTDARIEHYGDGNDPTLPALYYQFARYAMIAGSRPGTEPLNLQGIWNDKIIPPWNSGYTTNINAEMNYWDVLRGNLAECHEPFVRMVSETAKNGRTVAAKMFGYRGWCMFHNISIWRSAAPVDNVAMTSWWPVGAGWFCQHLWRHYQFTQDLEFLQHAYPIMRDSALFFCDWLMDRGDGILLTPVSTTPENAFRYTDADGEEQRGNVSMGTTMDMAIIRETMTNCVRAAQELGIDEPALAEIREKLPKLLGYQIGRHGQLQEWYRDFTENEVTHRHISHLYGLFPGDEITQETTPELVEAAKVTLARRGDGASGWSMGWKLCCWARLEDGPHFMRMLRNLLTPERTAPNMFDLHPPFQIDGNFGAARGIAETLVQDHRGCIHLLPALPPDWPVGSVRGLRTRDGFEVDLAWDQGKLTKAEICSKHGGDTVVRIADTRIKLSLRPDEHRNVLDEVQGS